VLVASQGPERLAQMLYKFKGNQNSKSKQSPAAPEITAISFLLLYSTIQ
jgi:hypothetical protein